MTRRFRDCLTRFARDSGGSVSVEFLLMAPILFWAFMASYVYFDAYRQNTVNLKAAYTIGDLMSRETEAINEDYIDSMYSLLQMLARSRSEMRLRVSVIRYDADEGRYHVDWSVERGYAVVRNEDNISEIHNKLPNMPDNERVILVETRNLFKPVFRIGLDNMYIRNLIYTRPRFGPQLAWSDT